MKIKGRLTATRPGRPRQRRGQARLLRVVSMAVSILLTLGAIELASGGQPSQAASYVDIVGSGSSWVAPAMNAWVTNVRQFQITVNYSATGSSQGRTDFKSGLADYGASEIPYGVQDGTSFDPAPTRGYAYIPDAAGGTTFMYNLNINGQRVTNLRLSGKAIADIFTNKITTWNDPEIAADNPQLTLPAIPIIPVVRSDGSGATADFTQWMIATQGADWTNYCAAVGRSPCTQTSTYPVLSGTAMQGVPQDAGVAGYVSQAGSNGAIGYVEYSYALQTGFPVAKVLNAAGYYTLPSPGHVAVSLLSAKINSDTSSATYLTEDLSGVYSDPDPRTYELSAYSYMIIPTDLNGNMTTNKGYTLGAFGQFLLCVGQSQVDALGYSALPINLVEDAFAQLRKIPGNAVPVEDTSAIQQCNNPTFSTNGTNTLAVNDPQPLACDKQSTTTQCAQGVAEPTENGAQTSGSSAGSGTTGGTTTSTGTTTGGTTTGGTTTGGTTGGTTTGGTTTGGRSTGGTTTGGTSTGGRSTAGGATGQSPVASGASTSGTGTTGTGQHCDPNTGACTPASGSTTGTGSTGTGTGTTGTGTGLAAGNGAVGDSATGAGSGPVNDTPITLAGSNGDGSQVMLMAVAAGMMLLLSVVPPFLVQAGRRSRRRRGIDEFYDDDWEERDR
jgi:phosphate ABC transporter phosphate-binding protein